MHGLAPAVSAVGLVSGRPSRTAGQGVRTILTGPPPERRWEAAAAAVVDEKEARLTRGGRASGCGDVMSPAGGGGGGVRGEGEGGLSGAGGRNAPPFPRRPWSWRAAAPPTPG